MLYEFKVSYNGTEVTKNVCYTNGKGSLRKLNLVVSLLGSYG